MPALFFADMSEALMLSVLVSLREVLWEIFGRD
jgi:hypothetical protein